MAAKFIPDMAVKFLSTLPLTRRATILSFTAGAVFAYYTIIPSMVPRYKLVFHEARENITSDSMAVKLVERIVAYKNKKD